MMKDWPQMKHRLALKKSVKICVNPWLIHWLTADG